MRGFGPKVLKLDCIEPAAIHNVMTKMPVLERMTLNGSAFPAGGTETQLFEIIETTAERVGGTQAQVAPDRG
jgi:hypothetical protein